MIKFAAQVNEWEIYELAVQIDHVHLYIGAAPKWSPSQMMRVIKGGTSKKIREVYPELDEVFWGTNATFWCDGYFVKSAGSVTDKVISEYVKRQKQSYK